MVLEKRQKKVFKVLWNLLLQNCTQCPLWSCVNPKSPTCFENICRCRCFCLHTFTLLTLLWYYCEEKLKVHVYIFCQHYCDIMISNIIWFLSPLSKVFFNLLWIECRMSAWTSSLIDSNLQSKSLANITMEYLQGRYFTAIWGMRSSKMPPLLLTLSPSS